MAAPGEHPHPQHLLDFAHKMMRELPDGGRDYIRRTGKMIARDFPASAPKLLPELRRLYALTRR
jgi:hypothetical protein